MKFDMKGETDIADKMMLQLIENKANLNALISSLLWPEAKDCDGNRHEEGGRCWQYDIIIIGIMHTRPGQIFFGKTPQTPQQNLAQTVTGDQFSANSEVV